MKNSVTDDHSFKHGCFLILIQYLTTALGRILFSSVVMVLAYQLGGPGSNVARFSYFCHAFISSPEHEVLMVSYWDSAVSVVRRASSVVNFLPCVRSRGHSFGRILMKVGQDVCLDEISDEFENGSCGVKN